MRSTRRYLRLTGIGEQATTDDTAKAAEYAENQALARFAGDIAYAPRARSSG
jgi:hypothetical protein